MDEFLLKKIEEVNERPELFIDNKKILAPLRYELEYDLKRKRAYVRRDLRAMISKRLKEERWTIAKLANLLGEQHQVVSRYLRGGKMPDELIERTLGILDLCNDVKNDI